MKIKKTLTSSLCIVLLAGLLMVPVSARWINTRKVAIAHGYYSGDAKCEIEIYAYSGTDLIDNVDIELSKKVGTTWVSVATWDDLSVEGDTFEFYDEVENVDSGYTYRLAFTAGVHRNGTVESLDQYNDVNY